MFLTPKKSNARNRYVIDVYALFAISYTHLPPKCAKIPYNIQSFRSAVLELPLERTMPVHCKKTGHDFVRVLAGELHANSMRRCRRRPRHDLLRALGGKFHAALRFFLAVASGTIFSASSALTASSARRRSATALLMTFLSCLTRTIASNSALNVASSPTRT